LVFSKINPDVFSCVDAIEIEGINRSKQTAPAK